MNTEKANHEAQKLQENARNNIAILRSNFDYMINRGMMGLNSLEELLRDSPYSACQSAGEVLGVLIVDVEERIQRADEAFRELFPDEGTNEPADRGLLLEVSRRIEFHLEKGGNDAD